MVAEALVGDRTIGMALLLPGGDPAASAAAIHPVGGAGEIVQSERLEDGRYNIVLEGKFRYRVVAEAPPSPYRVAEVSTLASVPFASASDERRAIARGGELYLSLSQALQLPALPDPPIAAERLVSELAIRLRYGSDELQELLETDSIPARFAAVIRRMREWRRRLELLAPFRPPELDPSRN
jgi:Lon protease-like protein